MAIGRLSVGVGKKGTASPHAEYIAREGKYEKDPNVEKLEATGHGNMPKWAQAEPNFFWKMSDQHERKNGSTYREHVIALPRELNESQRLALIHDWIDQEIGDKFAYQFAIHTPRAMDGLEQPHCHLMFSERTIDGIERDPEQYFKRYNSKNPERGGARKANTGIPPAERKAELSAQRDRWEQTCNKHLELANSDARISMKSLKEQGIDREPINFSMIQINKPSIRQTYMDQLNATTAFKKAKIDSLAVNVTDELRTIDKELHEQADRAIDRASKAINYSQSIIERRERRIEWSSKKHQSIVQRIDRTTTGISSSERVATDTEQRIINSKSRVSNSEQLITSSNEQLITITRELEKQQLAAEKLECGRIESRTAHKMLKFQLSVKIMQPSSRGYTPTLLKNAIAPIGKNLYMLLQQADNKGYDIIINNRDDGHNPINPETATNPTAKDFERFMLRAEVLSNPDIYNDFVVRLGIREFADKYGLTCNSEDLNQLDKLNPDPKMNVPQPQPENKVEPKPTNDHDFNL